MKSIRNFSAALAVLIAIGSATPAIAAWGNLRFDMKDPTDTFYIDATVGNRATSTLSLLGGKQNEHGTAWYHVGGGLRAQPLGDGSGNMTLSLDPTTVGIMELNGAPELFASNTLAIAAKLNTSVFDAYVASMSGMQPQVQSDWTATSGPAFILNKPTRTFSTSTRSLTASTGAAGFQVSATKDATVNYSVSLVTTATIGGSASGYIALEIAPTNSATSSVWTEIGRCVNGQTITLAIALQSVDTEGCQLGAVIPAGYYAKLRTVTTAGTPTYNFHSGQEVLQ